MFTPPKAALSELAPVRQGSPQAPKGILVKHRSTAGWKLTAVFSSLLVVLFPQGIRTQLSSPLPEPLKCHSLRTEGPGVSRFQHLVSSLSWTACGCCCFVPHTPMQLFMLEMASMLFQLLIHVEVILLK